MKSLDKLVGSLRRFPGIGPKQAERIALYLYRAPKSETENLVNALREVKERLRACTVCLNYSEEEQCSICRDPGRDPGLICVVEEPSDVSAIERSGSFRGLYHVLHGAISPLEGIGPESLRIQELLSRLQNTTNSGFEIILATDHDAEGEATALYLSQALKNLPVKITRIALGVPVGGDLDYIDARTLSSAMIGRREF